jgi:glutamate carboxypeptidase
VDWLATRREELVADLAKIVAMPTGHGHREGLSACRGFFENRLRALGARVEYVPGAPRPEWIREGGITSVAPRERPPLLVARKETSGATCRVLLCGHIDTVHDPASAFRELSVASGGSRATGPGCADMKGGLLVALSALEAAERANLPLSWTFLLVSDEETGSFHSGAALQHEAGQGYDAGLVFEPALPDSGLVVERPGSGQFMIECRGRAAHAGRDFAHGVSAVRALADAVTRACDLADPAQGVIVNIGPLEGGSATNIVPDCARAWGNVRFFSEGACHRVCENLDALNADQGHLPSTRVVRVINRPSKARTPGVSKLAELARDASLELGRELPFGTTGGVCDGNNIQAGGVPVIDTLGVRGGGLHTHDEWIELDSLVERAQLSTLLLCSLASGAMRS